MSIESKIAVFSIDSAALATVLIGLCFTLINTTAQKWTRHLFTVLFSIMTVYVMCNFLSWALYHFKDFAVLTQVMIFLESLSSAAAMPILTLLILHSYGEHFKRSPLFYIVLTLFVAYCVLLIITQFTEFIYYITPDNKYYRGDYYFLLLIPPVSIMAVNLAGLIRRRKKTDKMRFFAFLIYILTPMIAMLIQIFIYGLNFIVLGSALASLFMLGVIQNEQTRTYIKQQQEIMQQKAVISVLQMRPHFIYNTMMSIYYLCEQDSKKAQKVTLDFTNYLRKNFSAMANAGTIPFTEELDHTKAYLAVEQVRFEGEMFVEFDTPHTDFNLPPLTLQPIVENAVKHCVKPELDPTQIRISTRKTKNGSEVIVQDSGPGFGVNDNDEPHIALANIIERLKLTCGGTLTISPRSEGGTEVKLFIPR